MANPNQPNQNGNSQQLDTVTQNDLLTRIAATAYNTAGFAPVASTFKLTEPQIKTQVLNVAQGFISEIKMVTLDVNNKNGTVCAAVWLPKDSSHLRDTSTMNDNSAIKKPIMRYSKELKEFMDKFCFNDQKRTFSDEGGLPLVCIFVQLDRFFKIIFDDNGNEFRRKFGATGNLNTKLDLSAHFGPMGSDGRYGKFQYIRVKKYSTSDLNQLEPRARRSFNA